MSMTIIPSAVIAPHSISAPSPRGESMLSQAGRARCAEREGLRGQLPRVVVGAVSGAVAAGHLQACRQAQILRFIHCRSRQQIRTTVQP
jgi:hypothetical protein